VYALAALADGRLAAGCGDSTVRIVDVDAGTVLATLSDHTHRVTALAVLSDGALASGSYKSVRVWDTVGGECLATLAGHTSVANCLAVLADGRLASGALDNTVRLWDVGARTCVGVLTGHTRSMTALAALPDGRLATGGAGTIQLWDTRPAASAGASRAAGTAPVQVVGVLGGSIRALALLPDGRLACGSGSGSICLLEVPPPTPY